MTARRLPLAFLAATSVLLSAAPARAVNRVANGDFEAAPEPGASWTVGGTGFNSADIQEDGFATATASPAGQVFRGAWTRLSSGGNKPVNRKISQAFSTTAPVNVVLSARYKRTFAALNSSTFKVRVMEGATERLALSATGTTGDAAWVPVSGNAQLAAGSYALELSFDVALNNSGTAEILVDDVILQISPSAPVPTSTAALSPEVQVGFTATVGGAPPAAGYRLYRDGALLGDAQASPYADTTAAGNTAYQYAVTDIDENGIESPRSPAASLTTVPRQPGDVLIGSPTRTSLAVTWTQAANNLNTHKFAIDRAPDVEGVPGAWALLAENLSSSTYALTDSNLPCGTTYWYRVRGYNATGPGPWATPGQGTTSPCAFVALDDSQNPEPADPTVCPATAALPAAAIDLDYFTVSTNESNPKVDSITFELAPANAYQFVKELVLIDRDNGGSALKTVAINGSNTVVFSGLNVVPTPIAPRSLGVALVPGTRPADPALKQLFAISGAVTAFNVTSQVQKPLADGQSATVTINNQRPSGPSWATPGAVAGNAIVDLAWTNPAELEATMIVRATSPVSFALTDGVAHDASTPPAGVAFVYSGTDATTSDIVANGSPNHYWAASRDECANWSLKMHTGPVTPRGVSTVYADPGLEADDTLCPGTSSLLDAFEVRTDSGIDELTGVVIALQQGSFDPIAKVEIVDEGGSMLGEKAPEAGATSVTIPLNSALPLTETPQKLRVRVTAKDYSMPQGSRTLSGRVSSLECANTPDSEDTTTPPTLTVVRPEPAAPDTLVADPHDRRVQLTWTTTPPDAWVVVVRGEDAEPPELVDGQTYPLHASVGAAKVIYAGSDGAWEDTGLTNGRDYRYAAFARSAACGAWSAARRSGSVVPAQSVTRVEDGAEEPASATVCPGSPAVPVDAFQVRATLEPDAITSFTVRLGDAEGVAGVASVQITRPDGTLLGAAPPAGDTVEVTLSPALAVTTEPQPLLVQLVPKAHGDMPAPRSSRQVWAEVISVAVQTHGATANDTHQATLTIDGAPPAAPTLTAVDPGDRRVSLAWSAPEMVVLLRATQPLSGPLTDGQTYAAGAQANGGTVAYFGSDAAMEDEDLENGTAYHYALYARSGCGVYSEPALRGPVTPEIPTVFLTEGAEPPDAPLCPGAAAVDADAFALAGSPTARTLSSLTVSLSAGSAAFLSRVELVAAGRVVGAVDAPAADTVAIALDPPLALSSTPLPLTIRLAPKPFASLPSATGPVVLAARVTAAERTLSGADLNGASLTLDALAPAAPTFAPATALGSSLRLSWTNPPEADLAQVILVRGATDADLPEFGRSYTEGDAVGEGSVEYAGTGTEIEIAGALSAERFRLFARDACGSWSAPGRYLPAGLGVFDLGGCGCAHGAGPAGALTLLGLLGLLARRRPRR